jgi:hypothetical protein
VERRPTSGSDGRRPLSRTFNDFDLSIVHMLDLGEGCASDNLAKIDHQIAGPVSGSSASRSTPHL